MRDVTIVVLFVVPTLVLLGSFNSIQDAEGAVSWNGFLKQVGIGGTQVYEVSANGIILEGEMFTIVELLCLDGDWVNEDEDSFAGHRIEVDDTLIFTSDNGVIADASEITEDNTSRVFPRKVIGQSLFVEYFLNAPGDPLAPFDIPFTATILCLSPS